MKNPYITITIAASTGMGKTTTALQIKRLFQNHGIPVEYEDQDTNPEGLRKIEDHLHEAMESIRARGARIVINTQQVNRQLAGL